MIPLLKLSIVLFIAPVVYFYFTKDLENQSMILDILAIIAFLSSIVMAFLCDRKTANYKCNGCGKKNQSHIKRSYSKSVL